MISSKNEFDQFIVSNWNVVNQYIDKIAEGIPVPFYNSVDIRESKIKYAPVDNNIYPAGFNNICLLDLDETSYQITQFIKGQNLPHKCWGILVESNTKNKFYLDNLFFLRKAIQDSGIERVEFISFDSSLFEKNADVLKLETASKFDISIYPAQMAGDIISVSNLILDVIILNNDQSKPIDISWGDIKTPIFPPPNIGWYNRQKIIHFEKYSQVVREFASHFKVAPDLLEAKHKSMHGIDFSTKESFDALAESVDALKSHLGADQKIFLKASKGTYGMGIQVVSSGNDILQMNRKVRNKMDIGKNRIKFTDILMQEGVDTVLNYDNMPSEVTIYLINGKPTGGFMRANTEKDHQSNLNSKGMVFKKFCISEIRQNQDFTIKEAVYSVLARLSTIAAGLEIKNL